MQLAVLFLLFVACALGDFNNCQDLQFAGSVKATLYWSVNGDSISYNLIGSAANNNFLAFGISGGNPNSLQMIGSDATIGWYDGQAVSVKDYTIGGYSTCNAGSGVCPDDQAGGKNDLTAVTSSYTAGTLNFAWTKKISTGDTKDKTIDPTKTTIVFLASGPVVSGVVNQHSSVPTSQNLIFSRTPSTSGCQFKLPATPTPPTPVSVPKPTPTPTPVMVPKPTPTPTPVTVTKPTPTPTPVTVPKATTPTPASKPVAPTPVTSTPTSRTPTPVSSTPVTSTPVSSPVTTPTPPAATGIIITAGSSVPCGDPALDGVTVKLNTHLAGKAIFTITECQTVKRAVVATVTWSGEVVEPQSPDDVQNDIVVFFKNGNFTVITDVNVAVQQEDSGGGSGLSGGAIAGIVIASIVAFLIAVVLIFVLVVQGGDNKQDYV